MYSVFMDSVQLPIAPSKLQLKITNQNKTLNLIDGSEINILKAPGLSEVTFDVTIPQVRYPFASYPDGFKDALYFLNHFEALKTSKKPFQFIVSRFSNSGKYLFDTNLKVSLEDYSINEDAQNGLDLIISIKLKQFIDFGTRIYIPQTVVASATMPVTTMTVERISKEPVKTYTVKAGDTLWGICKKQLGNGSKYSEVAKLNGIKNPNLIYVGMVIKLV